MPAALPASASARLGAALWAAVVLAGAVVAPAALGLAPAAAQPAGYEAELGWEDIRGLQFDLMLLGFYDGAADGEIGPATRAAIGAFETAAGQAATGTLTAPLHAAIRTRGEAAWTKLGFDTYMDEANGLTVSYPAALLTHAIGDETGAEFWSDDGMTVKLWPFRLAKGQSMEAYYRSLLDLDFPGYEVIESGLTRSPDGSRTTGFTVLARDDDYVRYDEFHLFDGRLHGLTVNVPRILEADPLYPRLRRVIAASFYPFGPFEEPVTGEGIPLPE